MILTTPALSALKKKYPYAKLDFLVEAPGAEAVAGHPAIDEILVYDAPGAIDALSWALKIRERRYDWVIVDMPSIFHKTSLLSVPETDLSLLVSTSELPSLHLTRKAIGMLTQLGFEKDRYQVVVNRIAKRDGIAGSDMEKMFSCPVFASLPNDYFSLHRVVTLGEPLEALTELGKSIDGMVTKLRSVRQAERKKVQAAIAMKPALANA